MPIATAEDPGAGRASPRVDEAAHAGPAAVLDAQRLARLRWRCRRGMLENDLILERFLARRGDALTEQEVAGLDRLLDLPDGDLWDVLCERAPAPPDVQPLLQELRR
jgi:antitoxin CptB